MPPTTIATPIDDVTPEYWDHAQDVNLRHQFFAAQAVQPQMKELGYGSIVNFSSIAWRVGAADMAPYATAKAAVVGLTIRAGAGVRPRQHPRQRHRARRRHHRPAAPALVQDAGVGRPGGAAPDDQAACCCGEEIARTVLFLAADDSRMITKQSITVDAGLR